MRLGTRVWSVGKFFLLVGALGATFLLFFGISMRVALRAREVEVPELVGLTVSQATESLAPMGLGLRVDETQRPDPKIPSGHVMQQDPGAGMRARRQRTIRVWVSSGPRVTIVPALLGQSERTARIRLDQAGVQIGTLSEIRSADYPADAVVSQNPAGASQAPQVSLLVNRAEEATTYVMPDVILMDSERAVAALRKGGFLRVNVVPTQAAADIPPGTVIRQQPDAGFKVAAADTITLEVSR
jgi:serine/threonine-protein kinase